MAARRGYLMSGSKNPLYVDIMALHPEVTGSCIFCVVKDAILKKSVKLAQIESIMKDHQAQNYYMKERMRQIKENVTKLIRF